MEKHIPFEEVANKLMCRLEEKGYSDSYLKFSYEIDLHKLKAYLVKTSSMIYTKKLGTEFITITSMESVCQNRKNSYKRTIRHLNEILDEEEFHPISASNHSLRVFNYVLLHFEDNLRKKGLREPIQSTLIYTRITSATIDAALAEYWNHVAESELKVNGMNSAKDIDLVRKAKQLRAELLSE